ncbi:hypothetical protein [Clostridioides sp. ES-S-0048-02]|uniref:hypothetical protein n=1 Tax=Clostridioides sp. ES-S-0048-02 TaxID=2770777 RepID=UPI001D110719|nr:hypothetical protein [Clostridioides sp. ES-S-0048-02]
MIKPKMLNKHSVLFIVNILKKLHISVYLSIPLLCLLLILPKQLIYLFMLIILFHSIGKLYENKSRSINLLHKVTEDNIDPSDNAKTTDTYQESEFKDTLFINQVVDKKEYYILHDFKVDWKICIEGTIIHITTVKLFYHDSKTTAKIYIFDNNIDIYFDDNITLEFLYYKLQECDSFLELTTS